MSQLTKAEYDPQIIETILERWRATHHKRASAQAAGITEDTLANYLARGEAGDPRFSDFSVRFKKAEADWIAERTLVIRRAAMDGEQWQAAAWDLERHLPEDFGRKERHDLSGNLDITAKLNGNLYIAGFDGPGEGDGTAAGHAASGDGGAEAVPGE